MCRSNVCRPTGDAAAARKKCPTMVGLMPLLPVHVVPLPEHPLELVGEIGEPSPVPVPFRRDTLDLLLRRLGRDTQVLPHLAVAGDLAVMTEQHQEVVRPVGADTFHAEEGGTKGIGVWPPHHASRSRSPSAACRANSATYLALNPSFASFRSPSDTAASRSEVRKVNASPSPAHGSPNIRHRFATIDWVFHQEQFVVQIVFTVSSKTVAHHSNAPVLSDRQCRRTACPRHRSQNSPKSSSARNILLTLLRRNSRSASPIFRSGTET